MGGIRCNIRNDGRQRLDVCPFEIEMNILPHCLCSAQVTLHTTKIIVGLKLEVTSPDTALPHQGKVQCSVRYSPSSVPWKMNFELESMNFDLSRQLQNIMANGNGIDLTQLCILKNRLCWIVYIDALILEDNGNVFDALCLASTACFKHLIIPSLTIKNKEQYTKNSKKNNQYKLDKESLFKNTEISKKETIAKMQQMQKQKTSKFSGQQLPFQDSVANKSENIQLPQMDNVNIAEIEFVIKRISKNERMNGLNLLPIVVTMTIMDKNEYFVVDPLFEGEMCCDVIVRIAVYSNGNVSVIKYGDEAIDPMLIFDMIESAKQSGLKWMNALNECLDKIQNDETDSVNVSDLSQFELNDNEEKEIENEMMKQLESLSFVTDELQKEKNGNIESKLQSIDIAEIKSNKLNVKTRLLHENNNDNNLSNDEEMIDID